MEERKYTYRITLTDAETGEILVADEPVYNLVLVCESETRLINASGGDYTPAIAVETCSDLQKRIDHLMSHSEIRAAKALQDYQAAMETV